MAWPDPFDLLEAPSRPTLWPRLPKDSVTSSPLFAILFAGYGGLLTWSTLAATQSKPPSWGPIAATSVVLLVVGLVAANNHHSIGQDGLRPRWRHGLALMPLGTYMGVFVLFARPTLTDSLLPVVLVQGLILSVVFGILDSPILPAGCPREGKRRQDYLEIHLTNWWRWGQITMSFFLAFGIGIAANYYRGYGGEKLGLLAATSMVGVIVLAIFALFKFRYIQQEMFSSLGER